MSDLAKHRNKIRESNLSIIFKHFQKLKILLITLYTYFFEVTHIQQMKVLGTAKTSVLKNISSQNVNESFHFVLEDVENWDLRIDLKQKKLNVKGKSVLYIVSVLT